MSPQHPTARAFRTAIEHGDHHAAVALLADDVVFHSPIVHRTYEGKASVEPVLAAVVKVFEEFRYTAEYGSEDGHVLAFSCRVGGRDLSGVDIFRFGADGSIVEFTVMVRPYSAATALREQMAALLS